MQFFRIGILANVAIHVEVLFSRSIFNCRRANKTKINVYFAHTSRSHHPRNCEHDCHMYDTSDFAEGESTKRRNKFDI